MKDGAETKDSVAQPSLKVAQVSGVVSCSKDFEDLEASVNIMLKEDRVMEAMVFGRALGSIYIYIYIWRAAFCKR